MVSNVQSAPLGGMAPMPQAAVKPEDGKTLMNELMEILREGVASGDADADVPDSFVKLIGSGAGIADLLDALKQAMQEGRISPLLLARAEKVLSAAGTAAGAEAMTDRNQVLSNHKNMLTR